VRACAGDTVKFHSTGQTYEVSEVGLLRPKPVACAKLLAGQVGYIATGMRTTKEARVGDTVVAMENSAEPFTGFKPAIPMVWCIGLCASQPASASEY
jgi:translation factor GUF1, mitochondrial